MLSQICIDLGCDENAYLVSQQTQGNVFYYVYFVATAHHFSFILSILNKIKPASLIFPQIAQHHLYF